MNGYEGLREKAAWFDLSDRGVIRATGEDRARLLHAMSTNNIRDLQPGQGCYAFFLNAQGRILCDAYIYAFPDSLILDTEPETANKLFEHLDKYIIADDVTLEHEGGQWGVVALEGPTSLSQAAAFGISIPQEGDSVSDGGDGFVARVTTSGPVGLRWFMPKAEVERVAQQLTILQIPKATWEEVRTVRLENGIPRYGEDITERVLVQETQAMHAVNFNKGCYLGQEIVERVRSRAQIHRVLTPIAIEGRVVPEAGTKLLSGGSPAAEITAATYSPASGEIVGLAYVKTDVAATKAEMIFVNEGGTVRARVRDLSQSSFTDRT